jgi:hypothetical protein
MPATIPIRPADRMRKDARNGKNVFILVSNQPSFSPATPGHICELITVSCSIG